MGGGVRDLLLGREPKDFDVVTDARPEQIRRCFTNGRIIGRRFRLVHIIYKDEIIEVSTFRAHQETESVEDHTEQEMIVHDNIYGTFAEDAARRDFTVNALYYNISDFALIDFHQGLEDLQHGILRIIGDPEKRYREDPVRILRAVRFAAKLGFRIHEQSEQPIFTLGHLLSNVSPARLFAEMIKIFLTGMALDSFKLLRHYGLFKYLFPATETYLTHANFDEANHFISNAMIDTDERVNIDKSATPSYLVSVMLWYPLQAEIKKLGAKVHPYQAVQIAGQNLINEQLKVVAIPRRSLIMSREIWVLQEAMRMKKRSRVLKTISHPRFRAALDFLFLRTKTHPELSPLAEWWSSFYHSNDEERKRMSSHLASDTRKKKKKKIRKTA